MKADAGQFAAVILGALRTAAWRALGTQDERNYADFMGKVAFLLGREELLTAFLALEEPEQWAVLSAIYDALASIPLECGCGLPRI